MANLGRPEGLARLARQKLQLAIPCTKHSLSSDLAKISAGLLGHAMWLVLTDVAVAVNHGASTVRRHVLVVLKALPNNRLRVSEVTRYVHMLWC